MPQEARSQRNAGPCATGYLMSCRLGLVPRTASAGAALAFRIEHGIRHAFREWLSGFPYSENLPMGMSAKSIG
jgi:hypothetical protein